jgi:hypothetical protein
MWNSRIAAMTATAADMATASFFHRGAPLRVLRAISYSSTIRFLPS